MGILETQVNWIAILAAAIANMVLGFVWYSRPMFGTRWMALIGKRAEELRGAGPLYALTFAGALVAAYVLAVFARRLDATTLLHGMQIGFLAWIGFVATATIADYVFTGRPPGLWLINNGYQLLIFVVMGAIVAVWR
jgi:hypothetical protein